jgi:hypothetical protein
MVLNAIVKPDGTLIANVPKILWGKHVQLTIVEKPVQEDSPAFPQENPVTHDADENKNSESLAQWEAMSAIFHEADQLDIPRRSIDAILQDIHEFRESE